MLPREQQVQQVVAALQAEFPRFAPATVERRVRASFERYAEAPVRDFLPILVQRELTELFREAEALGAAGEPARRQGRSPPPGGVGGRGPRSSQSRGAVQGRPCSRTRSTL